MEEGVCCGGGVVTVDGGGLVVLAEGDVCGGGAAVEVDGDGDTADMSRDTQLKQTKALNFRHHNSNQNS